MKRTADSCPQIVIFIVIMMNSKQKYLKMMWTCGVTCGVTTVACQTQVIHSLLASEPTVGKETGQMSGIILNKEFAEEFFLKNGLF